MDSPPWLVLLLGGASGTGKTQISYRLARHYGVGHIEVDDFQVVLEAMTSPERYPPFHYWRLHADEARRMGDEEHVAFFRRYAEAMAEALTLVIGNRLETRMPVVLEGDFILPSLAVRSEYDGQSAAGMVRGLFLYEHDESQLARNYLEREREPQPARAHTSWCVSESIRTEAEKLGVPCIPARPWETVLQRAIEAIDGPTRPICAVV